MRSRTERTGLGRAWQRAWPAGLALLVLWGSTATLYRASVAVHPDRFVYALDDSYIHMAIGKHWAERGVWGVTPYEWSSTTSSPLWSLLLAGTFLVLGVRDLIPFALNLIAASALVCVADGLLARSPPPLLPPRRRSSWRAILLVFLVLAAPLPTLVMIGMEHVLQALINLLFVATAVHGLAGRDPRGKSGLTLSILAPFVTLIRYEGLFLVGIVAALYAWRRRARLAIGLVLLAALPILTYAVLSLGNGWYALPNPVMVKSRLHFTTAREALELLSGARAFDSVLKGDSTTHLAFLALAIASGALAIVRMAWNREARAPATIGALVVATATWWQIQFGDLGALGRYEAHLVVLAWWVLSLVFRTRWEADRARDGPRSAAGWMHAGVLACVLLATIGLLGVRAVRTTLRTVPATRDIYQQHHQLAMFLKEYYEGAAIAANDIGAINYYADLRCLDLIGLGSLEPVRQMRAGAYGARALREMTEAHGTVLAVVYESWFVIDGNSILPEEWTRVGQWTFEDRVVAGGRVLSFYAVRKDHAPILAERLERFGAGLPRSRTRIASPLASDGS